MQLRLASTSPRRSALLQQIGVSFVAEDSHVAEQINPSLTLEAMVRQFVLKKTTKRTK